MRLSALKWILMRRTQGLRHWRQRKRESLWKRKQGKTKIKALIVELQQQTSTNEAQQDSLRDRFRPSSPASRVVQFFEIMLPDSPRYPYNLWAFSRKHIWVFE
jgi:hypothetical protein